jgi:hypothetical protein
MAALVGSVHAIAASAQRSPTVASFTKIKSRLVELWPPAIVAVGLGLSVAWTASLFWLLYAIV